MSLSIIKRNLSFNSTVRKLGDSNSKTGDTFVVQVLSKCDSASRQIQGFFSVQIYVEVIADCKSLIPQVFIACKLTLFSNEYDPWWSNFNIFLIPSESISFRFWQQNVWISGKFLIKW